MSNGLRGDMRDLISTYCIALISIINNFTINCFLNLKLQDFIKHEDTAGKSNVKKKNRQFILFLPIPRIYNSKEPKIKKKLTLEH